MVSHAEGRRGGVGYGFGLGLGVGNDDGAEAEAHDAGAVDEKDTEANERQRLERQAASRLHQVVRELQALLATWTGACPACHRDTPAPDPA
ncbi:hypothetical protein [Streptomyces sp. NPDC014623]|uniref:hypothetical protein n=1 Tax=Streptomyces sp. NPDC014623 TaxID=3364875 RepID=UPI00370096A5